MYTSLSLSIYIYIHVLGSLRNVFTLAVLSVPTLSLPSVPPVPSVYLCAFSVLSPLYAECTPMNTSAPLCPVQYSCMRTATRFTKHRSFGE